MNFRPRRKGDVELNVTSFIDVVLLLLIFFMVSTTFGKKSEISITLPEASQVQTLTEPETITITLDAQDRAYINDIPLVNSQLSTIRAAIRDAATGLTAPTVIINADAETTHQTVVRIMDVARQLSLTKITFTTRVLDEQDAN